MCESFAGLSPLQVSDFIKEELPQVGTEVLQQIVDHKLDGDTFLSLNDEYLREVAPLLGDRMKLKKLIVKLLEPDENNESASVCSTPSTATGSSVLKLSSQCLGSSELDESFKESDADISDNFKTEAIRLTNWAQKFMIPKRFSAATTEEMKTGALTPKARDEIIHSLATLMMVHTIHPSPQDYNMVCSRLIKTYPLLKDQIDGGFSSWKKKLRMKFKNMRRPSRATTAGISVEPQAKKLKVINPKEKAKKLRSCSVVEKAKISLSSDSDEEAKNFSEAIAEKSTKFRDEAEDSSESEEVEAKKSTETGEKVEKSNDPGEELEISSESEDEADMLEFIKQGKKAKHNNELETNKSKSSDFEKGLIKQAKNKKPKSRDFKMSRSSDFLKKVQQLKSSTSKEEIDMSSEPLDSEDEDYKFNVKHLKRAWCSKKWSIAVMLEIVGDTADRRRKWIVNELPLVSDVLKKFPCFADSRVMIKEFCDMTEKNQEDFTDKWSEVASKVLKYARLENKRSVKKLIKRYSEYTEDDDSNRKTTYVMEILAAILLKEKSRSVFFEFNEGDYIPLDDNSEDVCRSPYIQAFGRTIDEPTDFKVVLEMKCVVEIPSLWLAIQYCFASYFVMNITYPKEANPLLLFLETQVFGLKASAKIPVIVTVLIDNLLKC